MGTRPSKIHGAQGPIPDPVATNTRRRKRGTMRRTPKVGIPRTHSSVGGFMICFVVQSPALLTTREYPFFPGTGTVAKPCHSVKGLSEIRVKLPGIGVTGAKFRQTFKWYVNKLTDRSRSAGGRHGLTRLAL